MQFNLKNPMVCTKGRILDHDQISYIGFSGSYIKFRMHGTKATITMITDGDDREEIYRAWFAVYVNDQEIKRFCLHTKKAEYSLFESCEETDAVITCVKLSEAQYATAGVISCCVEGELLELPKHTYAGSIEIIGDSITCGFGNESACAEDIFKTSEEDPTKAYAILAAKELNLDYHLVSHSGIGIISNWTDQDEPNECILMPVVYPCVDLDTSRALQIAEPPMWDFAQFQPDYIVINLGTNDSSYTKGIKERVERFGEQYEVFLQTVRDNNPNAQILCILGVLGDDLFEEIKKHVESFKQKNHDDKIDVLHLDLQIKEDGIGACGHPSLLTQRKVAKQLVDKIKTYM